MLSNPDRFIDNSTMSPGTPRIVKKCSARIRIRIFTEVLDVKNRTAVRWVGDAK